MDKPILAAMLSCSSTILTDREKRLFSKANPLGISLFSRNISGIRQLKKLIEDIKNTIDRDDVLIAIDEEGGRVSRLKNITKQKFVSPSDLGKSPQKYTKIHASLIAYNLKKLGINVNYAPVIEKEYSFSNSVMEGRCFSNNPQKIIKYAKVMADSYIDMGICPCIKHLPGHIYTSVDPHLATPVASLPSTDIKNEIAYLKNIMQYPLAMTSHVVLTSIDKNNPLTMSQRGISEIIRKYLGFDGFIISDAIDMRALKGSITEKNNQILDAGVDAVCYCSGKYEDLAMICQQKRFLTEKSLIRFANIKKVFHNNKKIDINLLKEQYKQRFLHLAHKNYAYDATEVLFKMQERVK